jgi:hypothetical protein
MNPNESFDRTASHMAGEYVSYNEPVAWMYKDKENGMVSFLKETLPFDAIPLYTHTVKELTDEEILEICDLGEWHKDEFAINFARAILRKTQEK